MNFARHLNGIFLEKPVDGDNNSILKRNLCLKILHKKLKMQLRFKSQTFLAILFMFFRVGSSTRAWDLKMRKAKITIKINCGDKTWINKSVNLRWLGDNFQANQIAIIIANLE